jgi:V-type H+-transporting ATPase subunit D
MDELEREEFFRIKKVVEKKKEKLMKERMARGAVAPVVGRPVQSALEASDKDPDLVF